MMHDEDVLGCIIEAWEPGLGGVPSTYHSRAGRKYKMKQIHLSLTFEYDSQ